MSQPADFSEPDWNAELAVADALQHIPSDVTGKGFYFRRLLEETGSAEQSRTYKPFRDYSLRQYGELLIATASQRHPGMKTRQALRLLGQMAYPTLLQTLVGKIMFGVLGNDLGRIMRASAKGYEVSVSRGTIDILSVGPGFAHIRMRDIYVFANSYQVGVFEGAIAASGHEGNIVIREHSPTDLELYAAWSLERQGTKSFESGAGRETALKPPHFRARHAFDDHQASL